MQITVKRVYDTAEKNDGFRILVDRLWPRGVSKEEAKIDRWLKEIAPSSELRSWFHTNKDQRFEVFSKKYRQELSELPLNALAELKDKDIVTLVTAVKDVEQSHIPTLKAFLEK